ncbi:uncharacterized protein BDZ83DRAFT_646038 [Colletotrichum acutatum]|uniref:Uncharacterized protein n=1 Tax=Glomerella acutata TaxID=27357 RepID=A0AAD8XQH0_GLOAC|nr:uncharacterized protein BDZ83DRAFT_646038 [Colletotrichum acutatum]KAK1731534.1 hypothetical protein BDZ83DRAFT_646038 [Colletotrichum acutatum]
MSCQLRSLEFSLADPPSRSLLYCLWSTSSDSGTIIVGLSVLSAGTKSYVELYQQVILTGEAFTRLRGIQIHDLEASFCRVTFSSVRRLHGWSAWLINLTGENFRRSREPVVCTNARATKVPRRQNKTRPPYYLPRTVWSILCITIVTTIVFGGCSAPKCALPSQPDDAAGNER